MNGYALTPLKWTQSSEQEYSYLTASTRHPTVLPQHPPKLYTRNTVVYLPKVDETCEYVFGMLPGFLENLLESGNLFCSATGAKKTALDVLQLWFSYFALSFFNEAKQSDAPVVGAFNPVALVVYGDDQFASLSVPFQKHHDTWHTRVSQTILSSLNSLSNFSQLGLSSNLAAASWSLFMHSSTKAFICAKLKHPAWKMWLSSAKWDGNVDKRKAPRRKYPKSHFSPHYCLTRQPHFLHTRCNCRPFVFVVVWCIARQADRNDITLQPSVATTTCRKTCFPQIVLIQGKVKPYLGFQKLGCHCKMIGCHFDTQKRQKKHCFV